MVNSTRPDERSRPAPAGPPEPQALLALLAPQEQLVPLAVPEQREQERPAQRAVAMLQATDPRMVQVLALMLARKATHT